MNALVSAVVIAFAYLVACAPPSESTKPLKFCFGKRVESVEELRQMSSCDVIEGNLLIAFRMVNSIDEWRSIRPLRVREVTGFVVLFFVSQISSLDVLLPNLRVIRGQRLFHDHALIIYGLLDLETINLTRLSAIKRGSVYIDVTPRLSYYVQTVAWDNITLGEGGGGASRPNHIQRSKGAITTCGDECRVGSGPDRYCWSADVCQTVCPTSENPLSCSDDGGPCPKECLGGCYVGTNNETMCYACQRLRTSDGRCADSCRQDYKLDDYRCLSAQECLAVAGRKLLSSDIGENLCVKKCPHHYTVDKRNSSICVHCEGCSVECPGALINSVESAEKLSECTKIVGSLEIRTFGKYIIKELQKNLGQIQEVTGYVHIWESSKLQSLNFLGNLNQIHGKELWKNNYSLVVHDNDNLQDLWNASLTITNGTVLIYTNPKLCPENIKKLVGEELWNRSVPNEHLRWVLNGKACENPDLDFWVEAELAEGVLSLEISTENIVKPEEIAGFYVYFRETWLWQVIFRNENIREDGNQTIVIQLKPNTTYELYVQLSTSDYSHNYQSKKKYATTYAFNPDAPRDIRVSSRGETYMEVSWESPLTTSDQIDYYILSVQPLPPPQIKTNFNICDKEGFQNFRKALKKRESVNSQVGGATSTNATEGRWAGQQRHEPPPSFDGYCNAVAVESHVKQIEEKKRREVSMEDSLTRLLGFRDPSEVHQTARRRKRSLNRFLIELEKKCLKQSSSRDAEVKHQSEVEINQVMKLAKGINLDIEKYAYQAKRNPRCTYLLKEFVAQEMDRVTTTTESLPQKNNQKEEQMKLFKKHYFDSSELKPNEIVVRSPRFNITNITSASYEIKVKGCLRRRSPGQGFCPKERTKPCDLCSIDYGMEIIYAVNEKYSLVKLEPVKVNGTEVRMEWSPPSYLTEKDLLGYDITLYPIHNETSALKTSESFCTNSSTNEMTLNVTASGGYSVRVSGFSLYVGQLGQSRPMNFTIKETPFKRKLTMLANGNFYYLLLAGSLVFVVIFGTSVTVYIRSYMKSKYKENDVGIYDKIKTTLNPGYYSSKSENYPQWKKYLKQEIEPKYIHSMDDLKLRDRLGEGKFGIVWRGILKTKKKDGLNVAVKESKSEENFLQLINEARLMLSIQSYHLVRTYGVVVSSSNLYLVMELMHFQSLDTYLKSKKVENIFNAVSVEQVMQFALQIADGMVYLFDQRIVHMDLAPRNCLVDSDLTVKISDFGLARILRKEFYKFGENKLAAWRSMPPEYFREAKFTFQSDVWSYGMLMWEIVNPGKDPYENMDYEEVKANVSKGYNLSANLNVPEFVDQRFPNLITACWKLDPGSRPTFRNVVIVLLELADENFKKEFKKNSYHYCGQKSFDDENYFSLSAPDSTTGVDDANSVTLTIDAAAEEEHDISPSTPLTSPPPSSSCGRKNRTPARGNVGGGGCNPKVYQETRERFLLNRCHHYLSSFRDLFSISRPLTKGGILSTQPPECWINGTGVELPAVKSPSEQAENNNKPLRGAVTSSAHSATFTKPLDPFQSPPLSSESPSEEVVNFFDGSEMSNKVNLIGGEGSSRVDRGVTFRSPFKKQPKRQIGGGGPGNSVHNC